jgi:hypothetical protein
MMPGFFGAIICAQVRDAKYSDAGFPGHSTNYFPAQNSALGFEYRSLTVTASMRRPPFVKR